MNLVLVLAEDELSILRDAVARDAMRAFKAERPAELETLRRIGRKIATLEEIAASLAAKPAL